MDNTTDITEVIVTKYEDGTLSLANSLLLYKIGKNYTGSLRVTITTSGIRMSFLPMLSEDGLTSCFKVNKHHENRL